MQLIIAEKPSLARNIVAGIGEMQKRNGFFEGQGYLVTWAFGHLFSLCDIEDYTGPTPSGRWELSNLPCFPETFRFTLKRGADKKVDSGVRRQFEIISALCNRADVDTIINAGDADREGEIIVRLCVQNALKTPKTQKRLWLPDQTPQTVAKALAELKDAAELDRLADEGFARTYIDWLYGVNETRYATLKSGTLLRVGRVIVPIVKAIYDRDMSIRHFVVEKYDALVSKAETDGETVELVSRQKFAKTDHAAAEAALAAYRGTPAVVSGKKTKKDNLLPGKLYSLSKLQNVLGKKFKMSMDDSLRIVQKLYEAGYVTYPRTNSEYLATAEKGKIKKILETVAQMGYKVAFCDKKTIFDDSKIESHSALTPTYKIPKKGALSDEELKVYQTIFRRFVAVFCSEPCVVRKTELVIKVGELEEFTLKGTVFLEPGWTQYDDRPRTDKVLPNLEIGDSVVTDFALVEKETTPPRHYTIETLNNYLKNPFREERAAAAENEDDSEDYRAMFEGLELGTEATRTGIIENAVKSGYIELKKDVYSILPGGEYLIESLSQMGISMDKFKTSMLGQALKKVYRGQMTVAESVELAKQEIAAVFAQSSATSPETDTDTGMYGEEVGVCPRCGKPVVKGKYAYGCTGYRDGCKFRVGFTICGRTISIANVRMLLHDGKTAKIQGFVSKNGKPFDAVLKLVDGDAKFDFS